VLLRVDQQNGRTAVLESLDDRFYLHEIRSSARDTHDPQGVTPCSPLAFSALIPTSTGGDLARRRVQLRDDRSVQESPGTPAVWVSIGRMAYGVLYG
jgi:hypothetical protein